MGAHIWVVEDDPGIQETLLLMLEEAGYQVRIFSQGQELIHAAGAPELYILDRQLSGMDGLSICKRLKADTNTMHIPVMIISASPQARVLAGLARADSFLEKPFSMEEMLAMVRRLLSGNTSTIDP